MHQAPGPRPPHGANTSTAGERSAGGDRGGGWRRRAVDVTPRLSASIGAHGFFLVVLPDETAVHAELERHGRVEADGHERGEEETAKLHPVILPGVTPAPWPRARYSAASR